MCSTTEAFTVSAGESLGELMGRGAQLVASSPAEGEG